MCHMFQHNKCYAQHLIQGCSKGWHILSNDSRTIELDTWHCVAATYEPIRKKRRCGNDASTRHSKTEPHREADLELRLRQLGFYNSELPSTQDLETAYELYKTTVEDSAVADEDKQLEIRKLTSAYDHINKAMLELSYPSTSDPKSSQLGSQSAAEHAS